MVADDLRPLEGLHLRIPYDELLLQLRGEPLVVRLEDGRVRWVQEHELVEDGLRGRIAVRRVEPIVVVVAGRPVRWFRDGHRLQRHESSDEEGRFHVGGVVGDQRRADGGIQIAGLALSNPGVRGLGEGGRKPRHLETLAIHDEKIRPVQMDREASLRGDCVGVLGTLGEIRDRDAVPADDPRNGRIVLGGGHDVQLGLGSCVGQRHDANQEEDELPFSAHDGPRFVLHRPVTTSGPPAGRGRAPDRASRRNRTAS